MASLQQPGYFEFRDELVANDFLEPAMTVMEAAFDPAYGEAWTYMQTLSMLAMPLSHNQVVLTADGEPAGFTLSRAVAEEEELLLIAVHPEHRGNGLAQILLSRLFSRSKSRGCKNMFLEVRSNNPALHLYKKMQFTQIGERKGYYTGEDGVQYDALTFARTL